MAGSREQGTRLAQNIGAGNRERGICIDLLIPAIGFLKPESLDFTLRKGFQAFEDPLGQASPFFRGKLENLGFQICDCHAPASYASITDDVTSQLILAKVRVYGDEVA
jgi:hypothetical protein